MASTQPVRMIVTKAQPPGERPPPPETTPSLQRSYTCTTVGVPKYSSHPNLPEPASSMYTPPPQYQEPPISLRPLHLGDKDPKSIPMVYGQAYPFQSTESMGDQLSYLSKPKTPFWRTKKGIAFIVLLSNVIIIAIVLAIVFGSQRNTHQQQQFTTNDNDPSGQNSEGAPSAVNQGNSLSSSSVSFASFVPLTSLSSSSPTSSSFVPAPTLSLFTPVGPQTSTASQAGANGGRVPNGPPSGTSPSPSAHAN